MITKKTAIRWLKMAAVTAGVLAVLYINFQVFVLGHSPWDKSFRLSNSPFGHLLATCEELSEVSRVKTEPNDYYRFKERRYKLPDRPFGPRTARRLCFGNRFRLEMSINQLSDVAAAHETFGDDFYDTLDNWSRVSNVEVNEHGIWSRTTSPYELLINYEDVVDGPVVEAILRARIGRLILEVTAVNAEPQFYRTAEGFMLGGVRWVQVESAMDIMLRRWEETPSIRPTVEAKLQRRDQRR